MGALYMHKHTRMCLHMSTRETKEYLQKWSKSDFCTSPSSQLRLVYPKKATKLLCPLQDGSTLG